MRRTLLELAFVIGASAIAWDWRSWVARPNALYREGIEEAKEAVLAGAPARARRISTGRRHAPPRNNP